MDCSTPGFPVHHQLLGLAQTHVHQVSNVMQPSSVIPFSSCLQSFSASRSFPMSPLFVLLIIAFNPQCFRDFPGSSVVKNLPPSAKEIRDGGSIPGSGRSPGVGNGNPLQYFCLYNSMDKGAWWAAVHGVTKSWTWLGMVARLVLSFWLKMARHPSTGLFIPSYTTIYPFLYVSLILLPSNPPPNL